MAVKALLQRAIAEARFQRFDFGLGFEDAGGWEDSISGEELRRTVYLAPEGGEGPTERAFFIVRFEGYDSTEVKEAYAIDSGGNLFGRSLG